MSQVTNKDEILRLESGFKFPCIFASDEYVKSKSKLESIMKDNNTLMNELELLHKCDETLTVSINEKKRELKLNAEVLAEMEMKKKSFEDDLSQENENLHQGMLKAQEEDRKMIHIIQQLHNEAENLRMEELYGQEAFNSNKIHWNLKFKEELNKLNEVKKKKNVENSLLSSTTTNQETSVASSSNTNSKSQRKKGESQNRTFSTTNKRKTNSSPRVKNVKQMNPSTPIVETTLDEQDSDDEEDVSLFRNYQHHFHYFNLLSGIQHHFQH